LDIVAYFKAQGAAQKLAIVRTGFFFRNRWGGGQAATCAVMSAQ